MEKLSPISRLAKAGIGFDGSPLKEPLGIVPNEGNTEIPLKKSQNRLFGWLKRFWLKIFRY